MFAAALVAATFAGGAALTSSSANAAPGPNAIPSPALVQTVDPEVTGIEQIGDRRHHRRHRHWRHHRGPSISFHFGTRPYYYGGYYPGYRRCTIRHRRVWTHWGWHVRPVRVCRSYW